jgi:hypothetical protein
MEQKTSETVEQQVVVQSSPEMKPTTKSAMGPVCNACQRMTPVFVDMIQDRTRDRLMLVIGMSFLLILIIFSSENKLNATPTLENIYFASPPQRSQSLGVLVGRAPRVFTLLETSRIPKINSIKGIASVDRVVVPDSRETLDCSTSQLKSIKDTVEEQRFLEPCKVLIKENSNTTDRAGVISFDKLEIDGPAGDYTIRFHAKDTQVSITETVSMINTVVALAVVNRPVFNSFVPDELPSFEINEALSIQPVLQIFGEKGKPLEGAKVIAFAWHSPYYNYNHYNNGKMTPFEKGAVPFPGNRFASFANAISEPSNDEGIAVFTNLTITGTTDTIVYLHFYCQGLMASWSAPASIQKTTRNPVFHLPLVLKWPNNEKHTVKMITSIPSTINEGVPIELFSIKLNPAPKKEKIVFAVVQQRGDKRLNPYYYTTPTGVPEVGKKRLINAIAKTNANGIATFDQLTFQRSGNSGDFTIRFVCDGEWSEKYPIKVVSSVSVLKVVNSQISLPIAGSYILSPTGDGNLVQDTAKFVLRALDLKNNGIPGKTPTVTLYKNDNTKFVKEDPKIADINLQIVPQPEEQDTLTSFTGKDGFVEIKLFFTHVPFVPANETQPAWYIKFSFDDGAATTDYIGPITKRTSSTSASGDRSEQVSSARFLAKPTNIEVGKPFDLEIQVTNKKGKRPMSFMTLVMCQSDYRPFYDPFQMTKTGLPPSISKIGHGLTIFNKNMMPCEWLGQTKNNEGCVDKDGKISFNLTLWAAPSPSRQGDDGFHIGYHMLLLVSNATAFPDCWNDGSTEPFCKFLENSNFDSYTDAMCRMSGAYPDNTHTVGPLPGHPEAIIAAATDHVSSLVIQPIREIRVDGIRTQQFDSQGQVIANSEEYTTLFKNRDKNYYRLTPNDISKWGFGKFESIFMFYKIFNRKYETMQGKGSNSRMTFRLLHVPESLPHADYQFGSRKQNNIGGNGEWSDYGDMWYGLKERLWTNSGGLNLINNMFVNEAKHSGGSTWDAMGEHLSSSGDNAANTKGKGKYFDGRPHVFKTFGKFDNMDPACNNFCAGR